MLNFFHKPQTNNKEHKYFTDKSLFAVNSLETNWMRILSVSKKLVGFGLPSLVEMIVNK